VLVHKLIEGNDMLVYEA